MPHVKAGLDVAEREAPAAFVVSKGEEAAAFSGGCLAENPGDEVPRYDFTASEREAIGAVLGAPFEPDAKARFSGMAML